MDLLEYNVDHY